MNFENLIRECGLKCSEAEFADAFESLDSNKIESDIRKGIKTSIHAFDEPYNGNEVSNDAGGEVYYVIKVGWMVFLQPFVPNVDGFQPLTSENVEAIMQGNVESLVSDLVMGTKIQKTVQYFESLNV